MRAADLAIAGQVDLNKAVGSDKIPAEVATAVRRRTRDEWAAHFASREACVSPVLSMTEAMADPHLQARGSFARWGEGQVPAAAPVFDGERPALSPPSRQVVLEEALQAWAALPAAAANTGQAAGPS